MRHSSLSRIWRKLHPASWLMMGLGLAILFSGVRGVRESIEQTNLHNIREVFEPPDQGFLPYLVAADPLLTAPVIHSNASGKQIQRSIEFEKLSNDPFSRAMLEPPQIEIPLRSPWIPKRLIIPAIGLDAPIQAAAMDEIEIEGVTYQQWMAPDSAAIGWNTTSARLAVPGNTVLNGHHNVHGEVFEKLVELEIGDEIWVQSGESIFVYIVGATTILPERNEPLEKRLENARWIQPSQDERLTLVTCWPPNGNTHRVIVVAVPLDKDHARTGASVINLE